jgi:hypothetical protein
MGTSRWIQHGMTARNEISVNIIRPFLVDVKQTREKRKHAYWPQSGDVEALKLWVTELVLVLPSMGCWLHLAA